jgi:hypothetical protein
MKILLPKRLYRIDPMYGPVFFLAGPVRGGGDWQARACREIQARLPQFYAALPCRYEVDHDLVPYCEQKWTAEFPRQLSWEREYLEIAAKRGCIVFWLPCQSLADPRPTADGPYGQDTYGELGEWRGRMMHDPRIRLVVGAEPGFPGLSQIKRNFRQALGILFPIYETLAETVEAALRTVRS